MCLMLQVLYIDKGLQRILGELKYLALENYNDVIEGHAAGRALTVSEMCQQQRKA